MRAKPAMQRRRIDQPRECRLAGEAEVVALGRAPASARARLRIVLDRAGDACAPNPAQLTIASNSRSPGSLPPKVTTRPRCLARAAPVTGVLKATGAAGAASSRSPRSASM